MHSEAIVFSIFLIFTGAAILSTIVLYTRQSMLVAYLLLGVLLGPWGLKWVGDSSIVNQIGDVGIVFLLFLLGLHLQPQNLVHMLKKVTVLTILSSIIFAGIGFGIASLFGFSTTESLIVGASVMFSSTIIGLKLLPTTILHHQHTGEVMISILLAQDIIAILVLFAINSAGMGGVTATKIFITAISLPLMIAFAFLFERFILVKLIARFDRIQEYIFLLSIAWCLSMAELSTQLGFSEEIGAFIAGVVLAESPIALHIAESLKPLRDFFLVVFFFTVGASFNLQYFSVVILPAALLAVILLAVKPMLFQYLLRRVGESKSVSWEVGVRLGQASEFSILVAYLAAGTAPALLDETASYLIQAATILTFMVSSYLVVMKYPTPVSISDTLRRD